MTNPPPETPQPEPADHTAATSPRRRRSWRRRAKLGVLGVVVFAVLFVALYTVVMLHYAYSSGSKAGYLQLFEDRGWLCKTSEGELLITSAPGVAPETWKFSVRNDAVAAQLRPAVGKRVLVFYEEHRGLPTNCFGATNFFVDSVVIQP